jgi:hypothetical protein
MCLAGCLLGSFATSALADDASPVSDEPAGEYAVLRDVQGPGGMFSARILLDINLSKGAAGEPISIAPDLYYGVSDKLQLGLLHTDPTGWQSRPGVGLCLTGKDGGCPKAYDNIGFDLLYALGSGSFPISAHGSVFLDSFDPMTTHLALGVAGKAHFTDRVALLFDPKLAIALDSRDTNKDVLYVPLELQFQLAPPTILKVLTGIAGTTSGFGDTYQVPLGLGLLQNLNKHFDLGARFSFDNLLGKQPADVGRADLRSFAVLLNVRS